MRCLFDESLPLRLMHQIQEHDCHSVAKMGWSGIKNGALLALALEQFDVFITADQNLQYQQNLSTLPLAVVVLVSSSNRFESLMPLLPKLLDRLDYLGKR